MPFSGNVFTLPAGATTATPGAIVQSAVWNAIHSDINTGMTQLMSQLTTGITFRNALCDNGDFSVWQRGAGSSAAIAVAASTTQYTADRWYITTGATQACTISATSAITNTAILSGKVQRNAAQTGVTLLTFGYPLAPYEVARLRGNKIDISCVLKAGANWSPTNGTLNIQFNTGTGASAAKLASMTGVVQVLAGSINLVPGATTAFALTSSIVVPVNAIQGELTFSFTPTGAAGVDDSVTIADVQVEGNYSNVTWTPTAYDRIPFDTQLSNCLVYFFKTFEYSAAPVQNLGSNIGCLVNTPALNTINSRVSYIVSSSGMFKIPAYTSYNPFAANSSWFDSATSASLTATFSGTTSSKVVAIIAATVSVAGDALFIHITGDAGI